MKPTKAQIRFLKDLQERGRVIFSPAGISRVTKKRCVEKGWVKEVRPTVPIGFISYELTEEGRAALSSLNNKGV